MNRKTRTVLCIAIVSAAFMSLISCRKDVPEGQLITAEGIVADSSTGLPFPGAKVYLFGGQLSFGVGVFYTYGPYDSAVTDALGHFSIRYRAEGSSYDYAVGLYNPIRRIDNSFSPYVPTSGSQAIFNFSYHLPDVRLSVYKTSGLKLHLFVDDVTQGSLDVYLSSGNFTFSSYYYVLRGQTIDTVLPARYVPGTPLSILYRPSNNAANDTLIGGLVYRKELEDTLQINGNGDTQVEKHIGSTNDFPWRP